MDKDYLYDPKVGANLLTTEQVADCLGYNYASVRHIVSEGKLKSYRQIGGTLLFIEAAVKSYAINHPKTGIDEFRDKTDKIPNGLEAKVAVDLGLGAAFKHAMEKVKDFTWEDIPRLKAKIKNKYGKDKPFTITVNSPDGCIWEIEHLPPTWIDDALKKLKRGK